MEWSLHVEGHKSKHKIEIPQKMKSRRAAQISRKHQKYQL